MRVSSLLRADGLLTRADIPDVANVLGVLVELQEACGVVTNGTAYYNAICERESTGTTAIGAQIALPHASNIGVAQTGVAALTLRRPLDWGAPDGEPVDLVFMVATPPNAESERLQIMARIVNLCSDTALLDQLRRAVTKESFLRIFTQAESDRFA